MRARHRLVRAHRPIRFEAMVPWGPVVIGVAILAGYLVYAVVPPTGAALPVVTTEDGQAQPAPAPSSPAVIPTADLPSGPTGYPTAGPARMAVPAVPSPTPEPTGSASPAPAEPTPTDPARPPAVTGYYQLEASDWDGFISSVVLQNQSRRGQDWTVELAFPESVGELRGYWTDGTPEPEVRRTNGGYAFTSTAEVPARSQVVLMVRFERTGRQITPEVCTVNGADCLTRQ